MYYRSHVRTASERFHATWTACFDGQHRCHEVRTAGTTRHQAMKGLRVSILETHAVYSLSMKGSLMPTTCSSRHLSSQQAPGDNAELISMHMQATGHQYLEYVGLWRQETCLNALLLEGCPQHQPPDAAKAWSTHSCFRHAAFWKLPCLCLGLIAHFERAFKTIHKVHTPRTTHSCHVRQAVQ